MCSYALVGNGVQKSRQTKHYFVFSYFIVYERRSQWPSGGSLTTSWRGQRVIGSNLRQCWRGFSTPGPKEITLPAEMLGHNLKILGKRTLTLKTGRIGDASIRLGKNDSWYKG